MSGDGIELRTLPLPTGVHISSKEPKTVRNKNKDFGPKSRKVNRAEKDVSQLTHGLSGPLVKDLPKKKLKKFDENMNTSKKTEKKTGLREWFMGKGAKTQKPKVANLPRAEVAVGPIVERLQKQSAYLSATLQQEENTRSARSMDGSSPEPDPLNYDDFFYKKHLLQTHSRPTWCDVCDDFIWGLYRSAIRCKYCRYTCHYRCHLEIDVECPKAPVKEKSLEDLTKETLEILNEKGGNKSFEEESIVTLPENISSLSELRSLIENYNKSSSLIMTLQDDGVFHGFIRVLMSLNRPVNINADTSDLTMRKALHRSNSRRSSRRHQSVAAVSRAASVKSMSEGLERTSTMPSSNLATPSNENPDEAISKHVQRPRRRSSFYMPQNTKKPLHITSTTTAYEVIEALLDKYGVTDNPQKFALYERAEEDNRIRLRKIEASEHPLVLSLLWGDTREKKSFSIQENERGDILWDAFEIPELKNFLVFLNREEEDMINQIRKKYDEQKRILQEAMDFKDKNDTESDC